MFESRLRAVDVPEGESGPFRIIKETLTEQDVALTNLRAEFRGGNYIPPGTYTRLVTGRGFSEDVVMSDTPGEMREHRDFERKAQGKVLIAGLGLGVILQAVAEKPEVEHVHVIEKSPDVIKLVWQHWKDRYGDKISLTQADIMEYKPKRGETYGAIWFDIWTNRCVDDLKEHTILLRRWARRAKWRGCWIHEELQYEKGSRW